MDSHGINATQITSYSSSINTSTQYRIVMRVGYNDINGNGRWNFSANPGYDFCDYHWWMQLGDGTWADKRGDYPTRIVLILTYIPIPIWYFGRIGNGVILYSLIFITAHQFITKLLDKGEFVMYLRSKKITAFLLAILLIYCSGCRKNSLDIPSYYSENDIVDVINSAEMLSQPLLSEVQLINSLPKSFSWQSLFLILQRYGLFLGYSVRYDYISSIISEYPPQVVRTIENNGQKSMYFIYETDDGTRVLFSSLNQTTFSTQEAIPL